MALASDTPNSILYNVWNGSGSGGSTSISAVTLSGGGVVSAANGIPYAVSCASGHAGCDTDVRGVIYDPHNGNWYYDTSPDNGTGTLGQVVFDNTGDTATLTPILTGVAAHGLAYDPLTNDLIANSGTTINQFDPSTNTIVSSLTSSGSEFDQAAVDGQGHLFVASNSGDLFFADYGSTDLIGTATFTADPFLHSSLDDVAPLSGTGSSSGVPEPMSLALFGAGLTGLGLMRRRRRR